MFNCLLSKVYNDNNKEQRRANKKGSDCPIILATREDIKYEEARKIHM